MSKTWAHCCGGGPDAYDHGRYVDLPNGISCGSCGITYTHAESVAVYPVEPAAKPISAEMALRSLDHQRQAHAAAFLGVPMPPVPLVTIIAEPAAKPGEADDLRAQLAEARAEAAMWKRLARGGSR